MIILDTNVLSELMREKPELKIVNWVDQQPRSSIWITSITYVEIVLGIETMSAGKRQARLKKSLGELIGSLLEHRVVPFDTAAAQETALVIAICKRRGIAVDLRDSMIAGIVSSNRATLATRNIRHFEDLAIKVVNPWQMR
jgi:toxin FitB